MPLALITRMKTLVRNFTILVCTGLLVGCQTGGEQSRGSASENTDTDIEIGPDTIAPVAAIGEDIRELMIDLMAYNACPYLKDRVFALSGKGGASSAGGKSPTIGGYWIRSCSAEETDSAHVRIAISGIGWKWISRTRSAADAEFELSENVKFQVDVTGTGTVDLNYSQENQVLTGYFIPSEPLAVAFDITADIDIETEELWSSIVGTAASALGESPTQRGRESIRRKGARKFKSRLNHGLTFIFDLCTGQRYSRFGTYPSGKIPESASPVQEMDFLANSTGVLHRGSLIMAGPYKTDKPLVAYVEVQNGQSVRAEWFCRYNAEEIVTAYVANESLPEPQPVNSRVVGENKPVTLSVESDLSCPVVLVLRPVESGSEPVSLLYRIYNEGDTRRPLVSCEGKASDRQREFSEE